MPRVTDEQIHEARSISLLSYFQSTSPSVLKYKGGGRYVHKDHDSFVISNGKNNQWYWNSQGVGGHSSLDYLMRIQGMGFLDAVKELTDGGVEDISHVARKPPLSIASKTASQQGKQGKQDPQVPSKPQKPPFTLPKHAENNNGMVAYLASRGISESTIRKFINQGLMYESASYSCIFVGRDTQDGNKPKYAAERTIIGSGKKDINASDKAFNFCLPPDGASSNNLAVCESPIDALSHHEIMKLAEAEKGTAWDGYRLSLSGTSSVALISFLERHPHVQNIYLCLDNDPAGQKATERIIKELLSDSRFAGKSITISPPPIGKDFNMTLVSIRELIWERENPEKAKTEKITKPAPRQTTPRRSNADFSV